MFLHDTVRRRLASLLQPWLVDEPELELELGLINSQVTAKNLRFDSSALNTLLDESSRFSFNEASVEHLSVHFSNWSAPAFKIEIRGVNVTLLAGEVNEEGRAMRSREAANEQKKKAIAGFDPEGSALHDVLERILVAIPSRNHIKTSLLNLLLKHCHLQIFNTNLQVKVPILNNALVYLWELREFNAESEYFGHECLFRGVAGAVFKPVKETSFVMDFRGFRFGYKMKDWTNNFFSSTDVFTSIKLNDLQVADFSIRVPELCLLFSPLDLPVLSSLGKLWLKESKRVRSGRQLWRIAAYRLGYAISSSRLSLHSLVELVCLWQRYRNAYEHLLSLVRYSGAKLFKKSAIKMSQDKMFLSTVEHNWGMISGMEKELPAEAIAQARRIARYRAALNIQDGEDSFKGCSINNQFKVFSKILLILAFMWNAIYKMLLSIVHCFFLREFFFQEPTFYGHLGITSEDYRPQYCFLLNFGKILISFSPASTVQNANEKIEPHIGISYSDIHAFCLSIDLLSSVYTNENFEQSLSVSCGQLKVKPSPLMGDKLMGSSSKSPFRSVRGPQKGRLDHLKSFLWVEPAQMFLPSQPSETGAAVQAEGACNPLLKKFLGEAWLNWKTTSMRYGNSEIESSENPWFLCEIKNCLTCPELKSPDSGFWKCTLTVGKINLSLEYSSVLSMAMLLGQIQHSLNWIEDKERTIVLSHSPPPILEQLEIRWEDTCELYANRMKMTLLRMLPEKHIQLGVFITGPHIQMLMRNAGFNSWNRDLNYVVSQDDFSLGFDIHNMEVVVWPTSKSDLALTGWPGSDDIEPGCHRLREPQVIEIPKYDNEKHAARGLVSLSCYLRANGLDIYMGDSTERLRSQIFALKPIAVQSSFFRESVHSFSTTVIALSAVFCAMVTGVNFISYMDELYVFFQLIAGLFSAVSYSFGSLDLSGYVPIQDFMRHNLVFTEPENDKTSAEGAPLIYNNTLFSINGTFKFQSMDIILQNSRITDKLERSIKIYDALSSQKVDGHNLLDCGIWICVQQACVEISCEERKLEVLVDWLGIQSIIFRYHDHMLKSFDHSVVRDLLQQSHNWLYEISLSTCTITLWLGQPHNSLNNSFGNSTSGDNTSYSVENSHLITECEMPTTQSCRRAQKLGFASNIIAPPSSHWILINVTLGVVFVARCSVKNVLVGAHQSNKLTSLISVGGNLQTISWGIQGGLLFIETTAVTMFARWFASYLRLIKNLLSIIKSSFKQVANAEPEAQETQHTTQQCKWELPEASAINVSQFSLVLVAEDDSGGFQELVIEVDVLVKLESVNMIRRFIFDLSRMSFFSRVIQGFVENESQIPHFSSAISNEPSSLSVPGDPAVTFQNMDGSHISHQNHILNHLVMLISAEKPGDDSLNLKQVWLGSGSVSGLDMTISLPQILMISSMVSSLSPSSNEETSNELRQRHRSGNQETDNSLEDRVPNGAIVAIQDVYQHMYFAVEEGENKYSLTGVIHYSLAGERALFRVKHHKQRMWKSSVLWFSLMSLHAKSDSGEPLRLNYRPGSGFVDISSSNDSGWSLWRALAHEPEAYKGGIDWEPYNKLVKDTFYLVNKKNDSAVAFVDGTPEFVRRPGNPFKFKVFHGIALAHDVATSDGYSFGTSGTSLNHYANEYEGQTSEQIGILPRIQIKIDKVSLTIVHEPLDTRDRFPLLRGCISNTELNVQILSHKTRVMNISNALLYYFDAQRNLWRELVHPVEICTFYRSRFQIQGSEIVQHGMPVHFYCRMKKLDMSLTEASLDVLLFVIGKLKLAGPFSVRSSMILANCCKVENQSGLNLVCHFDDNKSAVIATKQTASIFLRHPVLANQSSESASHVAIQLSNHASFATTSLHLSLLKTQALAWRTRIVSPQDSRPYPGPFVVVDISRKSEDGLSIVVSPLIRIHNETEFSMELRFRRPQQDEGVFASVLLNKGDSIDDSLAAFDAISLSGGLKKALMSLSVGNFLFSFRPKITDGLINSKSSLSAEWSDELTGGKAIRLSGIFDKLGYKLRRALSVESMKYSFSTAHCILKPGDAHAADLHFLIQSIGREVPILQPDNSSDGSESRNSAVALQEQKEIFLLPTVRVSNLLHSEIVVLLTENDLHTTVSSETRENIGKQATIQCGSTVDFYANPAVMYFTVTLTAFSSSCKPINSGDVVKKLLKDKNDVYYLDIDLDFGGGKYFASLRLSRGLRGVLEAAIFTPYSVKNDTEFSLLFLAPNHRPRSRDEVRNFVSSIPPELGLCLPPNSIRSWFSKSHKTRLKRLEHSASEALLDLDALSGLTEISLEIEEESGVKCITKFGVSVGPSLIRVAFPSQTVTIVPRHVVFNESVESISVCQCYLENEMTGIIHVKSKQRKTLQLQTGISKRREFSLFENIIRKHRNDIDTSLVYIQFRLNESESGWSGPVCIASLGHFFLKFRKQSNQAQALDNNAMEFAAIHVVEEDSTLGVHFYKPPNINLPYRIENNLRDASITYYQKDSSEQEVLGSNRSAYYVWDDLTLPHILVVLINDLHPLREIKLDKVRAWKPFRKLTRRSGLPSPSLLDKKPQDQKTYYGKLNSMEIAKVGYEVYAEGPTRVLRICEFSDGHKGDRLFQSCAKIQLRILHFAIHVLEHGNQDLDENEDLPHSPIIVARLGNISLDSVFTDQKKYNQISVQSLNVDQKWIGSPFAAMIRRHQLDFNDSSASVLKIVFVLRSTTTNVRQVEYSSIVLQPMDLNLDEETLMKVASFWRTSLSDSSTPSRQYYFDHFEIHPIKIIANFLPGDSYSSYNSAQETLRSLLHSVVKMPNIKKMVVELNGVLITHALITMRELFIRCAQHYSWYAMRAIYIAKGSPLLPPAFVSIFDDLASSALDVFFDPSRGLTNLPGITLGTFEFISKCINDKGFSGTKRYFGDLEKTLRTVGSNVLFAAVTEISDSVLKGAETSGFDGMMNGFHQGILKLAMEPSLLGTAMMGGGSDRKVKLDRSPGIDELFIEGYLQAMLDTMYRQEYLRVRVIDDQVVLKNLPPNSALIDEIMDRVKAFLVSKALLKGDPSKSSHPLRHLQRENEWKIGPTVRTLCEHLFVSFAIRTMRKHTGKLVANIRWKKGSEGDDDKAIVPADPTEQNQKVTFIWKWGIARFVLSGILAYIDGRLCRSIPHPVARRIVSGFLLSFLDRDDSGK